MSTIRAPLSEMLVSPAESEILRTAADKVWTQQTPAICNISEEYVKNAKCTAENEVLCHRRLQ